MLGMHPPFFQGVLVPLNMTNPVRFMTNPCLTNLLWQLFRAERLSEQSRKLDNKKIG